MYQNNVKIDNSILEVNKLREQFLLNFDERLAIQKEVKQIKIEKELELINDLTNELQSPILKRALRHEYYGSLLQNIINNLNTEQFEESKSVKRLSQYTSEVEQIKNLQKKFEIEQMNLIYDQVKNTEFEVLKHYFETDQFKNIIFR